MITLKKHKINLGQDIISYFVRRSGNHQWFDDIMDDLQKHGVPLTTQFVNSVLKSVRPVQLARLVCAFTRCGINYNIAYNYQEISGSQQVHEDCFESMTNAIDCLLNHGVAVTAELVDNMTDFARNCESFAYLLCAFNSHGINLMTADPGRYLLLACARVKEVAGALDYLRNRGALLPTQLAVYLLVINNPMSFACFLRNRMDLPLAAIKNIAEYSLSSNDDSTKNDELYYTRYSYRHRR